MARKPKHVAEEMNFVRIHVAFEDNVVINKKTLWLVNMDCPVERYGAFTPRKVPYCKAVLSKTSIMAPPQLSKDFMAPSFLIVFFFIQT
jgi:hypothetical protein